jgi:uncharacterized protein YcgI (DUF1989 family)
MTVARQSAADKAARIAALRARYEALRAEGQAPGAFAARLAAAPRIPRDLPAARVELRAEVPAGWYWFGRVPRGACLRLDNPQGSPGLTCLFWNAHEPSERFCATDTVKVQWTVAIGRGRLLLSDMGRVLFSIVEDTVGRNDMLLGAGPPRADAASSPLEARNTVENLTLGAAKFGLGPRDLHAAAVFFAPVRCGPGQRFVWDAAAGLAGHLDLYAELDALAVVSNCPHPLAPAGLAARDAAVAVWRPERPGLSAFCRAASPEAERAFAQTDAWLRAAGEMPDAGA